MGTHSPSAEDRHGSASARVCERAYSIPVDSERCLTRSPTLRERKPSRSVAHRTEMAEWHSLSQVQLRQHRQATRQQANALQVSELSYSVQRLSPTVRCRSSKLLAVGTWVQAFHICSALSNPDAVDIRDVLPVTNKAGWNLAMRIHESWEFYRRSGERTSGAQSDGG